MSFIRFMVSVFRSVKEKGLRHVCYFSSNEGMVMYYLLMGLVSILVIGFVYLKKQRNALYQRLSQEQQTALAQQGKNLQFNEFRAEELPSFAQHFAALPTVLTAETLAQLQAEVLKLCRTERSYLPLHKQGGTMAYETLHQVMPVLVALYHSPQLQKICSAIVGEALMPTPLNDQSSCSLLVYEKPGDHIGWHYDHNFYNGRHFTVLLPLINKHNQTGELSSARLWAKLGDQEVIQPTPPNTLVIFEGAKVLHKATPLADNELRILLSMTYCTTPTTSLAKGIARRIKDISFFGIRALWT